ncbi:MAG: hypothetical protein K0R63_719 [Rickettsiales bacterium]|jgi:hypothetical protein|nr:hypothetical protein [Rickettsiales bacterium]
MRYALVLVLILFSVSGCADTWKPRVGPPWAEDLLHEAPRGPINFKHGWRDGCETGISATANHFARFYYKFRQDYRLAQDNEYYTGWRLAWLYCNRFVFQYYKRDYL